LKLPQKIDSRHKIRDAQIVRLFITQNLTLKEIGSRFNLTASRIQQILYKHHDLIDWDKQYEKGIRVNALKRMAEKYPDTLGKKSSIEIYEQIRKEIEGDKPLVDNSVHQQIIMFRNPEALKEANIGTRAENRAVPKDAELSPR